MPCLPRPVATFFYDVVGSASSQAHPGAFGARPVSYARCGSPSTCADRASVASPWQKPRRKRSVAVAASSFSPPTAFKPDTSTRSSGSQWFLRSPTSRAATPNFYSESHSEGAPPNKSLQMTIYSGEHIARGRLATIQAVRWPGRCAPAAAELQIRQAAPRMRETIRSARTGEEAFLSQLAVRSKAYWGYSPEFLEHCRGELSVSKSEIAAGNVFVLEDESRVLGFCSLEHVSSDDVELGHLFVDPEAIGLGHGRALVQHAREVARARGYSTILIQGDPNAEPRSVGRSRTATPRRTTHARSASSSTARSGLPSRRDKPTWCCGRSRSLPSWLYITTQTAWKDRVDRRRPRRRRARKGGQPVSTESGSVRASTTLGPALTCGLLPSRLAPIRQEAWRCSTCGRASFQHSLSSRWHARWILPRVRRRWAGSSEATSIRSA